MTDGVARRVEVRDDHVDEGLARIDCELQLARRGHTRREHDLRITSLEALLHAHGMVGLFIYFLAETFLVLRAVDEHARPASRFYGVVQSTSPSEAESLYDDPGLPSLDLGRARAVGASYGDEEEGAHRTVLRCAAHKCRARLEVVSLRFTC